MSLDQLTLLSFSGQEIPGSNLRYLPLFNKKNCLVVDRSNLTSFVIFFTFFDMYFKLNMILFYFFSLILFWFYFVSILYISIVIYLYFMY